MLHITSYKTVLSQRSLSPGLLNNFNFYAFTGNAFVAVYTDDSDTTVSWDTPVDMLLNRTPLSSDISYERTRAGSHFIDNKEPVVQNLLSMSWQRTSGKQTSIATFCTDFPPYTFFNALC
jgi:hypothetical protein